METIIIIYGIGHIVSAVFFAVETFKDYQERYPSIAKKDRYSDMQYGVMIGIMKGVFWPISLPVTLLTLYFVRNL